MKRHVVRVVIAASLLFTGWSAHGLARLTTKDFRVTVDTNTGEVAAECGAGCLSRDDASSFGLIYQCDDNPCRVVILGRGRAVISRR
jgi:hypothetical protein